MCDRITWKNMEKQRENFCTCHSFYDIFRPLTQGLKSKGYEMELEHVRNSLETNKLRSSNGGEYWRARDIQQVLAYSSWEKFKDVIQRAIKSCESSGTDPDNNFHQTVKVVKKSNGVETSMEDYYLTRYACYLIAMNGDTIKPEIAIAQAYFAIQTRKQEMQDTLTNEQKRLMLRNRVKDANRSLSSTAKNVGVQNYALFHDAGYRGLYEMGLSDIKKRKGISVNEDLLDRASRTELAANEFRITQTEDKIIRERVSGEPSAIETHMQVGREVRNTIKKLGGKMPEDLPAETSIKKLVQKQKKEIEKLPRQTE